MALWSPTMATSPDKPGGEDSHIWIQWQRQLPDYVSWVNSQLRKLPGTRPVEDLRNDMRDGVALVCLIQVIGREKLTGVHMVPCNNTEMLENVERVLHFMTSNHIRMHHIAAKDIVNGNLKAIMRCILALAAHFKPDSVKHSQYSLRSPSKNQNVTSIAQGAAAALTDVRRNVARAGHRSRRNRDAAFNERREYYAGDGSSPSRTPPPPSPTCYYLSRQLGSSSDPCSGDSDHSLGRCSGQLWPRADHGQLDSGRAGAACGPNPHPGHRGDRMTASLTAGQFQTSSSMTSDKPGQLQRSKSTDCISLGKDSGAELEDVVDKEMYEELLLEYGDLYDAMNDTKKQLILLQDLLLSGQIPDIPDMEDELPFEGSTPSEQLVVMKSRLQNSTEVCNDLRDRLSLTSAECMELRGKTAGQQSRLTEQDTVLVQLKNDLLHRDFDLEKVRVENRDLQATVESLQAQLQALQIQMREKETTSRALRSEIADLHHRLQQVGETGEMLTARIATQDRRMAQLAGRMSSSAASTASSENGRDTPMSSRSSLNNSTAGGPESLNMVRECLATLRRHFQPAEPLRHTVDSLEQSVAALLEQAYSGALASPPHASQTSLTQVTFDSALLTTRHELDSTGAINSTMMNGQASTRVLYFTDKSVTPFMCTIHKRLGEIRLRDFKELFEHHGRYRFHFKALDPEYGTVKEEICNNDDLIPGWEGKIVAWVEEDNGTPC